MRTPFYDLQMAFMNEWRRCADNRQLDLVIAYLEQAYEMGRVDGAYQSGGRATDAAAMKSRPES